MRFPFIIALGALAATGFIGCVSALTSEPSPDDPLNSAIFRVNMLDARSHASLETVREAFDTVMVAEGFTRTRLDRTDNEAELTYRGEGDVPVVVKLKTFEEFTNIRIRYRLTGDEHLSRRLLEKVIQELGGAPERS